MNAAGRLGSLPGELAVRLTPRRTCSILSLPQHLEDRMRLITAALVGLAGLGVGLSACTGAIRGDSPPTGKPRNLPPAPGNMAPARDNPNPPTPVPNTPDTSPPTPGAPDRTLDACKTV